MPRGVGAAGGVAVVAARGAPAAEGAIAAVEDVELGFFSARVFIAIEEAIAEAAPGLADTLAD